MRPQKVFSLALVVNILIILNACVREDSFSSRSNFYEVSGQNISFTDVQVSAKLEKSGTDAFYDCGIVWSTTPHPTNDNGAQKIFRPTIRESEFSYHATGQEVNTTLESAKQRIGAVVFNVGTKILIGTGASSSGFYKDFVVYYPEQE